MRRAGRIGCLAVVVALLWSGACAAQILNPSFEETYPTSPDPRELPSDWWPIDLEYAFNSDCTNFWSTDGALSVCLYNYTYPGATSFPGDYQSLWQYVDLTGVDFIVFDAMLLASFAGEGMPFEASFLVDGVPLWSQNVEGLYLDQIVEVIGIDDPEDAEDLHMIELRFTSLDGGSYGTQYTVFWDNLGFYEGTTTIGASIDLDPAVLDIGCSAKWGSNRSWGNNGKWITCTIELEEGYDAAQIDGSTVMLEDIPAYLGRECWAKAEANRANLADFNRDGILERMVKFEREEVEAIVEAPETTVTVRGLLLDGTPFEGTATIKVIDRGHHGPRRHVYRPMRWWPAAWRHHPPFAWSGWNQWK